jgi:alkylation response protein AidB-like acyl-CoA dehydrogenase
MEVTLRGNLIFYLKTSQMLSLVEANPDHSKLKNERLLLRLFIPLLKLFTAKECIKVGSEGLEGFGAMGYIEGSGIPTLMRDLQVKKEK